ncbi:MAG: ATP-dependent Clp protease ATP-binding subunit [Patescibacteria group bacterium]
MDSQFYFNLKKAKIFTAVKWGKTPVFRFAKLIRRLFFALFFFFLVALFYRSFPERFLALSLITLSSAITFWLLEIFFKTKLRRPSVSELRPLGSASELKKPRLPDYKEGVNLAEFLSLGAANACWEAIKFSRKKKLAEISSEALLYFALKDGKEINFIFTRALLYLKGIKKDLKICLDKLRGDPSARSGEEIFSLDFQKVILLAFQAAKDRGGERIGVGDLISAFSEIDITFKKYLVAVNLKNQDIKNLNWWLQSLKEDIEERKKFWEWKNLIKQGSLAKNWTAGYTLNLDKFSLDLSDMVKRQGFPETIGHQKEIQAIERILSRREKNNVLMVGESGSGRKSIIQAIAKRSVLGESLKEVNYKRVVQLDLASLTNQGAPESLLNAIFNEVATAGNIILVIDEFHNFLNISGVILPYLALPNFPVIAITTFEGLHRNIEQNSSILDLFEKVEVAEISERETLLLLENLSLILERRYRIFISYSSLREIVRLSDKYLPSQTNPEKVIKLLDEIIVYASQKKARILLPEDVFKIVSEKTQIPVGEIETKEKEVLLNLENLIHQRIINQEEAVREVSSALRRARAEVSIRKGTIGSFLFLGPTGVGKTETAKALATIYFGSENKMIRLDMSEFQDIADIPRLIGSPGQEGLLTTKIREAPFSLILLDEIEKAHPNILNLFLQVLDEGQLTDGLGRKTDFKNSIIIATSNAGYQIILEALKENTVWDQVKAKLLDFVFEKAIFRPEFINRFDSVVVFGPLSKNNLLGVAELLLKKLKKNLAEKEIEFVITPELKAKIVELGYDPTFGARQMQRVIQDKIGNVLATAILSDQIKRGSKVEIDPETFQIKQ